MKEHIEDYRVFETDTFNHSDYNTRFKRDSHIVDFSEEVTTFEDGSESEISIKFDRIDIYVGNLKKYDVDYLDVTDSLSEEYKEELANHIIEEMN